MTFDGEIVGFDAYDELERWKTAFQLCRQQRDAALSRAHDLQIDLSIAEAKISILAEVDLEAIEKAKVRLKVKLMQRG